MKRFWYNAEIEPTAIESKQATKKIKDQNSIKSQKENTKSLVNNPKIIIFGNAENNKVTDKMTPS